MKIMIWIVVVLAILWGFAGQATAENREVLSERETKLAEINSYIVQRHRQIDDFCSMEMAQLQARRDAELIGLRAVDKGVVAALWSQTEAINRVLRLTGYKRRLQHFDHPNPKMDWQRSHFEKEETRRLQNRRKWETKRYATSQHQLAEAKGYVQARYVVAAAELERKRNYALTVGVGELEKRMIEKAFAKKRALPKGTVNGIVYSSDMAVAIIDGEIVQPGQKVYDGFEVVEIGRDYIVLTKDDVRRHLRIGPAK